RVLRSFPPRRSSDLLDAADRIGSGDWLRSDLANQFGAELAERLERGTRMHAARRVDEMRAASELLVELGVAPLVTEATVQRLARSEEHTSELQSREN